MLFLSIFILGFYVRFFCNGNSASRDLKTIHLVQISHYVNETQISKMSYLRSQSTAQARTYLEFQAIFFLKGVMPHNPFFKTLKMTNFCTTCKTKMERV